MYLKQITEKDQLDLKKIYFHSIISIDDKVYTSEQKRAIARQPRKNKKINTSLKEEKGWLINEGEKIIAFATRYPKNKISLLYCKGDSQRKGYGTKLLKKIENEAIKEGLPCLSTEASLISYKLFLKNSWEIIRKEKIIIKNITFERYKMIKNF